MKIDETAGLIDQSPWLMRFKATINVCVDPQVKNSIVSATGIHGPYGDVVNYDNKNFYVSWYPLCKLMQTNDVTGHELSKATDYIGLINHKLFIEKNIREMAAYVPSMAQLINQKAQYKLGGGVIMAKGETDINDHNSYLHQRSLIGPKAFGSYITVDTGKYCTAPQIAMQAAKMILEIL